MPTFLGKPVPAAQKPGTTRRLTGRALRRSWGWLVSGCMALVLLAGATASYRPAPVTSVQNDTGSVIALALPFQVPIATASSGPMPDPCANVTVATQPLFPFIPDNINAKYDPKNLGNGCNPTYWNLPIVAGLAGKLIYILNWIALVLAIALTVYAGLLYISGFANEANIKKAKTLLIVCYTGLIIVFLSRVILLGFSNLISPSQNNANTINQTLSK